MDPREWIFFTDATPHVIIFRGDKKKSLTFLNTGWSDFINDAKGGHTRILDKIRKNAYFGKTEMSQQEIIDNFWGLKKWTYGNRTQIVDNDVDVRFKALYEAVLYPPLPVA